MSLKICSAIETKASRFIDRFDKHGLSVAIRYCDSWCVTVLVYTASSDHAADCIPG